MLHGIYVALKYYVCSSWTKGSRLTAAAPNQSGVIGNDVESGKANTYTVIRANRQGNENGNFAKKHIQSKSELKWDQKLTKKAMLFTFSKFCKYK